MKFPRISLYFPVFLMSLLFLGTMSVVLNVQAQDCEATYTRKYYEDGWHHYIEFQNIRTDHVDATLNWRISGFVNPLRNPHVSAPPPDANRPSNTLWVYYSWSGNQQSDIQANNIRICAPDNTCYSGSRNDIYFEGFHSVFFEVNNTTHRSIEVSSGRWNILENTSGIETELVDFRDYDTNGPLPLGHIQALFVKAKDNDLNKIRQANFTLCLLPQTTNPPPVVTEEPEQPNPPIEPPVSLPPTGNSYSLTVISSPQSVQPRQTFRPILRACVTRGVLQQQRGDLVINTNNNTFGAHPHLEIIGTVQAGGCQDLQFYENSPMIAPDEPGTYESRWQLQIGGNLVSNTEVTIRFTVGDGSSGSDSPRNQIIVYDDPGFNSELGRFGVGRYGSLGSINDRIHSVAVPSGMSFMAYEHSDFQGQSQCFNADVHSLPSPYMEGLSSLVVYDNSNCSDTVVVQPTHPALTPSCGAVILRDSSGNELRLSGSVSNLSELSWNDRNLVIVVEGPFSAVAFDDFAFTGHQHGPIGSGQSQAVGSNVSSVQVTQTSPCDSVTPPPDTSCAVAILRDTSGNELRLTQSVSNLSELGWNDRDMVITVEGPLSVTTFDDAAYLGFQHGPINTGQSQGVGSNTSSVQLTFTGPCEEPVVDNWCYPGQPWGDGRCNNPDPDIQNYTWMLGWYMYRLNLGLMTCSEIPSEFIPNPICLPASSGGGTTGGGGGGAGTPVPTPIFTPIPTTVPAECTAASPGVYLVDSGGVEIRFTSSDNNLADNGWNDRAVTIRVEGPYRAYVYDDQDFSGYTRGPYTHGWVEGIGNNVSSVRVEIAIVCP